MKTSRPKGSTRSASPLEPAELSLRLAEAEAALRAIRSSEVDTMVVEGKQGNRVFTLDGAEQVYRRLIESMNEGALMLTADKMILYANQRFAGMVKCPLEQVTGGSFRRFLSAADQLMLRPLMRSAAKAGSKIQLSLLAGDGSPIPALISIRELANKDSEGVTIGMVVTDMTEARRTEELLRALTHRVVQVQEAERASVALELHDNITQLLCGVLFSSQALADKLSPQDGPAKAEALKLCAMLGQTAEEVDRISRHLRPSVLEHLGLPAVLRATGKDFTARTGVAVKLACGELTVRLPADTELALYRILQEALKNVEKHARARHVTVGLRLSGAFVEMTINDDGVGFDAVHHAARREGQAVLGLLGMHERAALVGGAVVVKSGPRAGTEIMVRLPLPPSATAAA